MCAKKCHQFLNFLKSKNALNRENIVSKNNFYIYYPSSFGIYNNSGGGGNGLLLDGEFGDGLSQAIIKWINFDPLPHTIFKFNTFGLYFACSFSFYDLTYN